MGKFTFEGQGAYAYLVYQMDENDQVDRLSLGMLTSNKIPGLLPVVYTQMDGQGYVKYNISSKVCAKNFFAGAVSRKRLLGIFSGVAEALMSADDYMLDRNSILLDLEYIYADVSSCDAALVCVPAISMEMRPADPAAFFKQIIFSAQFDPTENSDYVTRILNYLNSTPMFSLPDFKELVDTLRRETSAPAAPVQVIKVQEEKKTVNEIQPGAERIPVRPAAESNPPVMGGIGSAAGNARPAGANDMGRQPANVTPAGVGGMGIAGMAIPGMDESAAAKEPAKSKGVSLFGGMGGKKKEPVEKQEKKSLFGMKPAVEKAPAKAVKEKKAGKEMSMGGGFSIPGMDDGAIPVTPVMEREPAVKAVEVPVKAAEVPVKSQNEQVNIPKVNSYVPEQPAVKKNPNANFGDTVNLSKSAGGKTTMLSRGNKAAEVKPYLVRMSNNEQIYLTKPLFHIGQEPGYADYCIMDNPAVSHAHADVSISQGKVLLTDTGSTNGTYVNGQMLNANVPVYLNHGDKVTFADEEFVFYQQ